MNNTKNSTPTLRHLLPALQPTLIALLTAVIINISFAFMPIPWHIWPIIQRQARNNVHYDFSSSQTSYHTSSQTFSEIRPVIFAAEKKLKRSKKAPAKVSSGRRVKSKVKKQPPSHLPPKVASSSHASLPIRKSLPPSSPANTEPNTSATGTEATASAPKISSPPLSEQSRTDKMIDLNDNATVDLINKLSGSGCANKTYGSPLPSGGENFSLTDAAAQDSEAYTLPPLSSSFSSYAEPSDTIISGAKISDYKNEAAAVASVAAKQADHSLTVSVIPVALGMLVIVLTVIIAHDTLLFK